MDKLAKSHLAKKVKLETDQWLETGAATDSVRKIGKERSAIRVSQDETATEEQVNCEYNIQNDAGGRTETNMTTGRGTPFDLAQQQH